MPDPYFAVRALVRAEATRQSAVRPPQAPRPTPPLHPAPQPDASPVTARHAASPKAPRSALTSALRALRTVFG
ncbi:hypothetical protein [Kitasatospora sp. NPDC004289]